MQTTKDELIKHFGSGQAPKGDDPHMTTTGAHAPTGVENAPFPAEASQSRTDTSLPERVSQQTIASENKRLWGNVGPADNSE